MIINIFIIMIIKFAFSLFQDHRIGANTTCSGDYAGKSDGCNQL